MGQKLTEPAKKAKKKKTDTDICSVEVKAHLLYSGCNLSCITFVLMTNLLEYTL